VTVTENDPGAALRAVAAHPYLLAADAASGAEPIQGPMPTAEVLDLGFGVADGLVELHSRGLVHGRISPVSLVVVPAGGLRLALPVSARDAGEAATDVARLQAVLADLLPGEPDPLTDRARSVLTDPALTTAVGLRDALASVRLGELPARVSTAAIPSTIPVTGAATAGVKVNPAGDRTPLQARDAVRRPVPSPTRPAPLRSRSAVLVTLVAIGVLIVVAVAVYLLLH
jgi:hypothetical protein